MKHARYKYYTYVRQEFLKEDWNRDRIQEAIFDEGIDPSFKVLILFLQINELHILSLWFLLTEPFFIR